MEDPDSGGPKPYGSRLGTLIDRVVVPHFGDPEAGIKQDKPERSDADPQQLPVVYEHCFKMYMYIVYISYNNKLTQKWSI
jgi:hypothetical protein